MLIFQIPFYFLQTVPGNLTRYGLSQIINHLLGLQPSRPFDFLIQDELLRLSLHQHMASKQLTTEAVLEVEYVPAVLPPTPKEEHPHDDWISALAVLSSSSNTSFSSNIIAAGCYDGVVRLWQDGESVGSFAAHKGAIKSSAAINGDINQQLITGGADCVARVWRWSKSSTDGSASPELLAVLKGHTASIEAVVANADGDRCVTAGWDGQILMYRAGEDLEEAAGGSDQGAAAAASKQKKKRRTDTKDSAATTTTSVPTGGYEESALTSLTGHTQCVSSLAWPSQSALITGCWDHSVKVWDPELSTVVDTYSHNKAVHCIATPTSRGDASLIAFGGPEKSLRVWDRRAGTNSVSEGTEAVAVRALASHTDWISDIAWHPTSEYHVLSVSYDQSAKLWDLRASVPLHTLPVGGSEKLLSCIWVGEGEVAYGGADNVLRTCAVDLGGSGGGKKVAEA